MPDDSPHPVGSRPAAPGLCGYRTCSEGILASPRSAPEWLDVVIEVSRGGRVKWSSEGGIDFVSPVPCPFNYGSVPDRRAPDGDPLDALVLGPACPRGQRVPVTAVGRVRFLDDGQRDDKLICLPRSRTQPPTGAELRRIQAFFTAYALVKATSRRVRTRHGATRFEGVDRGW